MLAGWTHPHQTHPGSRHPQTDRNQRNRSDFSSPTLHQSHSVSMDWIINKSLTTVRYLKKKMYFWNKKNNSFRFLIGVFKAIKKKTAEAGSTLSRIWCEYFQFKKIIKITGTAASQNCTQFCSPLGQTSSKKSSKSSSSPKTSSADSGISKFHFHTKNF